MKYVLFVSLFKLAEDLVPREPAELRRHVARIHDFHARGALLMSGPFQTPGEPLSTMAVFRTSEAAEEFAAGDPFVLNGMARGWDIRPWHEMVPEPAPASPGTHLPLKQVLSFTTTYRSLDEAARQEPDKIRHHIGRTQEFHAGGNLLMAGALQAPDGPLATMAILTSRTAAEAFAAGDPFVLNATANWHLREWTDIVAQAAVAAAPSGGEHDDTQP